MTTNNLIWLLKWYYKQCGEKWDNGDRLNGKGIQINTMDNPGWGLKINLEKAKMQNKSFEEINIERSEQDWICCFVKDGMFRGYGGLTNFPEILQIFRNWVENY